MAEEGLGIKATIDSSEIQKGAEQFVQAINQMSDATDKAVNSMSDGLQFLDSRIRELAQTASGDIIQKFRDLASEASRAGESFGKSSGLSLDLDSPREQLRQFDADILRFTENLGKYFDDMQARLNGFSDILGAGKTAIGSASGMPSEQISELTRKNEELTSQIQQQQSAIASQRQEFDSLGNTVRSGATPAMQEFGQSVQAVDKSALNSEKKDLLSTIGFDEQQLADMSSELQTLTERLAALQAQRAATVAQPVQNDPLSIGVRNNQVSGIDSQIGGVQNKIEEITSLQKEYTAEVGNSKARIQEIDAALGTVHQKQNSIRTEILQARNELIQLSRIPGGRLTEAFQTAAKNAGLLRRQMMMSTATMQYYADPIRHVTALKSAFQGAAGAASLATGVMGLFNTNSEKMAEIQTKIQSLLGVVMGLETTYAQIKRTSMMMMAVEEVQRKANIRAIALETAAKEAEEGMTVRATIAQAAFNLVAEANPYVLLAMAVATVVGAVWLLVKAFGSQTEEQKKANKAVEEAYKLNKQYADSIGENASKNMVAYERLRQSYNALGNDMKAKKQFITQNQDAFHQLGISVGSVSQANNVFIKNTPAMVDAIMAQARAAAYASIAADEMKKAIQMRENAKYKKAQIGDVMRDRDGKPKLDNFGNKTYLTNDAMVRAENQQRAAYALEPSYYMQKNADNHIRQQLSQEKTSANILKGAGISRYTGSSKTTSNGKTGTKTDEEKQKEAYESALRKLNSDSAELDKKLNATLEEEVSKAKINSIRNAREKELAQMKLEHDKKLAQIDKEYNSELKKRVADEEKLWKNTSKNSRSKTFNAPASLTPEQENKYAQIRTAETSAYNAKRNLYLIEQNRKEEASMDEYLSKYGDYESKKKAILRQSQRELEEAGTDEGKKNFIAQQLKDQLSGLDFEHLKKDLNWELVFGNIQNASKKMLQEIKKQLKAFINSPEFQELKPTDQKTVIEGYQKVNSSLIGKSNVFSGLVESIKNLKESSERFKQASLLYDIMKNSPEAYSSDQINEAGRKKDSAYTEVLNSKGDIDEKATQITTLSVAIAKLGSSSKMSAGELGQVTADISKAFSQAAGKIGGIIGAILQLIDAIGKQGLDKFLGNILSSVSNAVGGVLSTVGNIFTGYAFHLGGADYTSYEEMKVKYQSLSKVWDELISKKQKYLKESYGTEVIKTEKEIQDLLQNELESYKALGLERLKAGASTGSHSIGVRQYNNMDSQALSELVSYYKISVPQIKEQKKSLRGILGDRMENLFSMSADELEKLKENATTFWATMDSDVRTYLENIIKSKDTADEAMNSMKEQLLGTSLTSFEDGWKSMLEDLSSDNAAFADDFEKKLIKSVISEKLMPKYKNEIESLYEQWYKAAENGGISVTESDYLQQQTSDLSSKMLEERNSLMNAFGFNTTGSASGTVGSSSTMSQDTGNEINGRMTAIEEILVEIKSQNSVSSEDFKTMGSTVTLISTQLGIQSGYISEIVDVQKSSASLLSDIKKNTNELYSMNEKLDKIEQHTRNI